MRLLALYLRARRVPAALAMVGAATAALWALSLTVGDPSATHAVAALAAALGAAAIGPGLGGTDPELERTAGFAWPPRRAAHVAAAVAVVALVLAATALTGRPIVHSGVLVRDAAGFGGLVALGAVILGADRAWLPALGWAAIAVMSGQLAGPWYQEALTWAVQPAGTTPATVTAAVLAGAGALGYAAVGVRGRQRS